MNQESSSLAPPQSLGARFKEQWLSNPKNDVLAALTVALALIPEAIAFSIIAGVDPKVGLYAAFIIATSAAIFGGRPGMISGATGAVALVAAPLVRTHGVEFLFAATILTGLVQLAFRLLRLSRYMKFVPRSVMTGFVNALAILIFSAQVPQLVEGNLATYGLVAAGLLVIYVLPRFTKVVPAPLVAIVALTLVSFFMGLRVPLVGDMGQLPSALPSLHLPQVPLTLETLRIIAPFSIAMAMVGIIESLLTASVVDEMTDTPSCKHTEAHGQGIANLITGFFGGMAGCAMIGQSVINVQSGGRTRLSGFCSGVFLLVFVVAFGELVALIPGGALVAVMIAVAVGTFDWSSFARMRVLPISESIVMVSTVATVLWTHDLSKGVLVGILLSAVFFARSVGELVAVEAGRTIDGRRVYVVTGELFFVSVESFVAGFDLSERTREVEIDLSQAHIWDASAVAAIDRVVLKLREAGAHVHLTGLNRQSSALLDRLARHKEPGVALASAH